MRACCSSCKVCTLRPIVRIGDTQGACHLGDAPSLNFKVYVNVIKVEKETTTQMLQTHQALGSISRMFSVLQYHMVDMKLRLCYSCLCLIGSDL